MKTLLVSVLILSTTASAFADHTVFVPKPADAPVVTKATKSTRTPSLYPPYTRNGSRIQHAKQPDPSSHPASIYPAYSRSNPHSQPAATSVITVAGATSQKRPEVSDK